MTKAGCSASFTSKPRSAPHLSDLKGFILSWFPVGETDHAVDMTPHECLISG
jgi:hypothetical protein